jgi:hypothetical protein
MGNNEANIKASHFTGTDKRNVIDLLLSNENVLLFIYEKLFPRTQSQKQYSCRATFQPMKFERDSFADFKSQSML